MNARDYASFRLLFVRRSLCNRAMSECAEPKNAPSVARNTICRVALEREPGIPVGAKGRGEAADAQTTAVLVPAPGRKLAVSAFRRRSVDGGRHGGPRVRSSARIGEAESRCQHNLREDQGLDISGIAN